MDTVMRSVKQKLKLSEAVLTSLKQIIQSEHPTNDGGTICGAFSTPDDPEVVELLNHGFIETDGEIDDDGEAFYMPTAEGIEYFDANYTETGLPIIMNDFTPHTTHETHSISSHDIASADAVLKQSRTRNTSPIVVNTVDEFDWENHKSTRATATPYQRESMVRDSLKLHELRVGQARHIPAEPHHLTAEGKKDHPAKRLASFVANYNKTCVANNVRQKVDTDGNPLTYQRKDAKTGEVKTYPEIEYVYKEFKLVTVDHSYAKGPGAVIVRIK